MFVSIIKFRKWAPGAFLWNETRAWPQKNNPDMILGKLNSDLQRKIIQEYLFPDVVAEINSLEDRMALDPPLYIPRQYFEKHFTDSSEYLCIATYNNNILIWMYTCFEVGYISEYYHIKNNILRHSFTYFEFFNWEHQIYDARNEFDIGTIITILDEIFDTYNLDVSIEAVDCLPISYTNKEMIEWIGFNAKRIE